MIPVFSVDLMRRSDRAAIAAGTPGAELMRRAGRAVFGLCPKTGPVGILCGAGNNGGDGFVLALELEEAGVPCAVYLLEESSTPDASDYLSLVRKQKIPVCLWQGEDLSSFSVLVDCLFGTGFHGKPEGRAAELIRTVNSSGAFVLSVDLNSGLNGDSGRGEPCVVSDLTVAVGAFKPGHFLGRAKDVMRRAVAVDIGIPPVENPYSLLEESDLKQVFPPRPHDSHKGTWGTVTLIGGSLPYSGAIRLSAASAAALRAGAGIARIAAPRSICPALVPQILESTLYPLSDRDGGFVFSEKEIASLCASSRVIAVGMGIGLSAETQALVAYLLESFEGTLVIDADGLNALSAIGPSRLKGARCRAVLTPHAKEFSRLTGAGVEEILDHPVYLAQKFAAENGCTLLLKGAATVVADENEVYLADRGSPGMATAGSGDVLSGVLAALLSYSPASPAFTAAAASAIAGMAGEAAEREVGAVSLIASDTVRQLPGVIRTLAE